jgi:hypothetical protein
MQELSAAEKKRSVSEGDLQLLIQLKENFEKFSKHLNLDEVHLLEKNDLEKGGEEKKKSHVIIVASFNLERLVKLTANEKAKLGDILNQASFQNYMEKTPTSGMISTVLEAPGGTKWFEQLNKWKSCFQPCVLFLFELSLQYDTSIAFYEAFLVQFPLLKDHTPEFGPSLQELEKKFGGSLKKNCHQCHILLAHPLRCIECKFVWYCSKECQKKHWKHSHKSACNQAKWILKNVPLYFENRV